MTESDSSQIVGIGGTTRPGSSSERVLRYALRAAKAVGARIMLFNAKEIELPINAVELRFWRSGVHISTARHAEICG